MNGFPAKWPDDLAIDYVEMYVDDLAAKAFTWVDRYGFTVVGTGGSAEHRSVALRHGPVTLVLTAATSDQHPASAFVQTHGDGVADIALRTADVTAAFEAATRQGAAVVRPLARHAGPGPAVKAAIAAFGEVVHTLVQRPPGYGPGLPVGFAPSLAMKAAPAGDIGLLGIDHLAICLDTSALQPTTEFYQRALGFREVFAERVIADAQAMESRVVRSSSGSVTFTRIEPDPEAAPGKVDDFLKNHHGAGVEHISFVSDDAVRTSWALAGRGVTLLPIPGTYYDSLGRRRQPRSHTVAELRAANVLADADASGELFQLFTLSTHPRHTVFFEVIERKGAQTFGRASIRALYEGLELAVTREPGRL